MSVRLVHKSADGKLAILAVRLPRTRDCAECRCSRRYGNTCPRPPAKTEKVADMVNPSGLLPAERGYWTYMGSRTTPPCTEGVRWFVFEQEVTREPGPAARLQGVYKVNTREVQDLHGRKIAANE